MFGKRPGRARPASAKAGRQLSLTPAFPEAEEHLGGTPHSHTPAHLLCGAEVWLESCTQPGVGAAACPECPCALGAWVRVEA